MIAFVKQKKENLLSIVNKLGIKHMAAVKKTGKKSLDDVLKEINKGQGAGSISRLGEMDTDVEKIPTGIVSLDQLLEGGLARGHMVEVYGGPGGGKSALSHSFIGQAQKVGDCAFIDLEGGFETKKARLVGVDTSNLILAQPTSGEDTFEIIEALLQSDDVAAIVVDSVAGMVPRAEIEGDPGDSHVGLQARLMSQGMRRLHALMRENNSRVIVFWINQIRANIGAYGPVKTTTTGGKALPFWSATRMEVTRTGAIKKGDNVIGQDVKVKVVKNRFAPPFNETAFELWYEKGIMNEGPVLDTAVDLGLVNKSGNWYTVVETGQSLGNGRSAAVAALSADTELFIGLSTLVLEATQGFEEAEEIETL